MAFYPLKIQQQRGGNAYGGIEQPEAEVVDTPAPSFAQQVTLPSFNPIPTWDRNTSDTNPTWGRWLDALNAAAPGGISKGSQIGNAAIGSNQKFRDVSTAGAGQYDPANAAALQGLQNAYNNPKSTAAQKAQAEADLKRRFPFQYPSHTPWSLG